MGKKQRDDLFKDIDTLYERGQDRHHFMATIVCHETKDVHSVGSREYRLFDIVDGQQRLTTLILLLKSIHINLEEGEDKKDIGKILVKPDGHLILLQTKNYNRYLFESYLKEGRRPRKDEIKTHADRCLNAAITECDGFVKRWQDSGKDLLDLLRLLRNRLGFVVYDTADNRSVYSLFEVLNSRGLAVDWLDKCKSILMGRAFELTNDPAISNDKIEGLHSLWGNIYSELALYPIPGHEVLRVMATIYLGPEEGKPMKAETALEKLRDHCDTVDKTEKVTKLLYDVARKLVVLHGNRTWGPGTTVLQARLLAVALMLTDSITEDERNKILEQWERVTFRIYGLFNKDSRSKVGEYVKLANKIMSKAAGATNYKEIIASLKDIGKEYPIEQAVEEGLDKNNIYDDNPDACRYILWKYEEHLAKLTGNNAITNEELRAKIWEARSSTESIEHIHPQLPERGGVWDGKISGPDKFEVFVNLIGNLILLPQPLNSEANREGFTFKKNIYLKSEGLRMIREIIDKPDWTEKEIKERHSQIIKWAKSAWADIDD